MQFVIWISSLLIKKALSEFWIRACKRGSFKTPIRRYRLYLIVLLTLNRNIGPEKRFTYYVFRHKTQDVDTKWWVWKFIWIVPHSSPLFPSVLLEALLKSSFGTNRICVKAFNGLYAHAQIHSWTRVLILSRGCHLQEVFHVYLNKFENAVTDLFPVIFGNNWFQWVSLISRKTPLSRKQFLIFNFWFETVSEDE